MITLFDLIFCVFASYIWATVDAPLWQRAIGLFGVTIGYIIFDEYMWKRDVERIREGNRKE